MVGSAKGWINTKIFGEWFTKIFEPSTRRVNNTARLLLLDGLSAHFSLAVIRCARANNVRLVCLPAHTSHQLQPLDVGVYGPHGRQYAAGVSRLLELGIDKIQRAEFLRELMKSRETTIQPKQIRAGWNFAGIVPWNPSKVLNRLPRRASTPEAAPIAIPSTPRRDIEVNAALDVIFRRLNGTPRSMRALTGISKSAKQANTQLQIANRRNLELQKQLNFRQTRRRLIPTTEGLFVGAELAAELEKKLAARERLIEAAAERLKQLQAAGTVHTRFKNLPAKHMRQLEEELGVAAQIAEIEPFSALGATETTD